MDISFFERNLTQSWNLFRSNLTVLAVLLVLFLLFTLLIRKRETLTYIKSVLPESLLNLQAMGFNLLVIPLWIAVLAPALPNFTDEIGLNFATPFWGMFPNWLLIPITLFIGDFIGYWRHRFEHSRFFWPSHAMHHSDTQMTWLTLERFHPFNRMTTFFVDSTLLALIGLPPLMLFVNNTVRHYYGFWVHANLPWDYGILGRIFVSPAMHRWHHAQVKRAYNANFASIFSVFDQWFGTYYVPGVCEEALGSRNVSGRSFTYQLTYPFRPSSYKRTDTAKKSAQPASDSLNENT
ncbi:fatty acid hydroxylase [Pseudidiomarina aquimaris]|uniref:Fatty acid hydroxylase n=1 Tax=Pseudidiomarina aquimaris TaxID=641841 RepID=A0A432XNB4_9GAMM|nr:sterol desaturase family protein [Pseudidiomarina aquimaris]RUO50199.1 fatty acid hydroxylase [Pseudidiomarina aquimaris]